MIMMTREEFMTSQGKARAPDRKITLDIFDIAEILTAALQDRGFLQTGEKIHAYDMEPALAAVGYYLTIERKNDILSIRRAAR